MGRYRVEHNHAGVGMVVGGCALALSLLGAGPGAPDRPETLTGRAVKEREDAERNWQDFSSRITMRLISRRGKERVQSVYGFRKETGGETRSILWFESPPHLKGTALLTHDYREEARSDDQWLFLPSLEKVRRIPPGRRKDPFMGTDFSFEDLKDAIPLEDFHYRLLGRERRDGVLCYRVEGTPRSPRLASEIGYHREVTWVRRDPWITVRGERYDARGQRLKTFTATDLQEIDGVWTARTLTMTNHRTDHQTRFEFAEIRYNTGVPDAVFTQRALRRPPGFFRGPGR